MFASNNNLESLLLIDKYAIWFYSIYILLFCSHSNEQQENQLLYEKIKITFCFSNNGYFKYKVYKKKKLISRAVYMLTQIYLSSQESLIIQLLIREFS
jgi:hypothetical protein